jgi:hypothetical protein
MGSWRGAKAGFSEASTQSKDDYQAKHTDTFTNMGKCLKSRNSLCRK